MHSLRCTAKPDVETAAQAVAVPDTKLAGARDLREVVLLLCGLHRYATASGMTDG